MENKYIESQRSLLKMIKNGDNSEETEIEYNKILLILDSIKSRLNDDEIHKRCEIYYCLCMRKRGDLLCEYHLKNDS